MNRIGRFEKVSEQQYIDDYKKTFPHNEEGYFYNDAKEIYKDIMLPHRATSMSAGYVFYAPFEFTLYPGETINIPTGIRVQIDDGWVLQCYPRSGLGFKYKLRLNNSVGIIDGDYFYSNNGGHIFIKLTNETNEDKTMVIEKGQGFAQGIFVPYGITYDDNCTVTRDGGFGSTDKR